MGTTSVIYGMTRSEYRYTEDYVPSCDGWKRLRDGSMPAQDMLIFNVPHAYLADLPKEAVAEALFIATNAPERQDVQRHGRLAEWLLDNLEHARFLPAHDNTPRYTRALSVGDTVSVFGQPSLGCQRVGWSEIA